VTRYVFQLIARASGTNTISSPTPHHVQSDTCAQPVQDNRVTIAAAVTVAADPGSCTLWAVMVKERGEGGSGGAGDVSVATWPGNLSGARGE
jgi:hypothetical protein